MFKVREFDKAVGFNFLSINSCGVFSIVTLWVNRNAQHLRATGDPC